MTQKENTFNITSNADFTRNVITNENSIVTQHREFLTAATSENTRRAYQAAIRHFLAWGGVLPADETSVIRYMLNYAALLNPKTLSLRLTALSQWHLHQGFNDVASTPTVRKTLKGIERKYGRPQKKAKALPIADLELIVTCLENQNTLSAKRDNALLQLCYFGGYRRSEIVGIDISHITWEREGIVITLPRSKTDQHGEGIVKAIPYGSEVCCPINALRKWIDAAQIITGPLFRSLNKQQKVGLKKLHPSSVNTILMNAGTLAKLDYVPNLSSHSLRRGMATSAYRAGAGFREIKRQGGWRHDGTVQGYIEEAGLFTENAVNVLLKGKT